MDCAGPLLESDKHNTHILVITDHFSKYVELIAMQQPNAANVAEAFVQRWALRYGPPQRLLTDNGPEFKNATLVGKVCEAFQITKVFTTPFHPEGNGLVERFMHTIKKMLLAFIQSDPNTWDEYLDVLAYAYNTSLHATTGEVPRN